MDPVIEAMQDNLCCGVLNFKHTKYKKMNPAFCVSIKMITIRNPPLQQNGYT